MTTKISKLLYTALAVTFLSGTSAIAQSPIDAPSAPLDPGAESPTPQPEAPAEPAPEESISPESAPAEETPGNVGGAAPATDGSNSLVACGPNGAAFVRSNVSPGCHLLKVNSPPNQAANAES